METINSKMMNTDQIKQLLSRYYEGSTTPDEEQRLADYFLSGDVDPELKAEQHFFRQLYQPAPLPEGLEHRLGMLIDACEQTERNVSHRSRRITLRWMSVAASVVVVIAASALLIPRLQQQGTSLAEEEGIYMPRETYSNPQDAYVETQRALAKFSSSINKGLHNVQIHKQ